VFLENPFLPTEKASHDQYNIFLDAFYIREKGKKESSYFD